MNTEELEIFLRKRVSQLNKLKDDTPPNDPSYAAISDSVIHRVHEIQLIIDAMYGSDAMAKLMKAKR